MAGIERLLREAEAALERSFSLALAEERVPARPGLYAIHGSPEVWAQLGLGKPPDARPLYIGKAEGSLLKRGVRMHFCDGRTGWSSPRRSLSALLHDTRGYRGIPRGQKRPDHFSNYGLSETHEDDLTRWMWERLELAIWEKPTGCLFALDEVESVLLRELLPPLNTRGVTTPWTAMVKAARAVMAAEARAWSSGEPD